MVWATIAKIAQGIDDDNLFGILWRCDLALRRSAADVIVLHLVAENWKISGLS